MKVSTAITKLNNLKQQDVYSLSLFCLYKLTNVPEYSSLSELSYVLDKDNLLNLCKYFGGQTIKIPTLKELKNLINALLLYQYVKVENMTYDQGIEVLKNNDCDLHEVKIEYRTLCDVLKNYDFQAR